MEVREATLTLQLVILEKQIAKGQIGGVFKNKIYNVMDRPDHQYPPKNASSETFQLYNLFHAPYCSVKQLCSQEKLERSG